MVKYLLDIDDELWEEFKKTITRDKSINKVIVEMIEKRVEKEYA